MDFAYSESIDPTTSDGRVSANIFDRTLARDHTIRHSSSGSSDIRLTIPANQGKQRAITAL